MTLHRLPFSAVFLWLLASSTLRSEYFPATVPHFFKENCIKCHGPDKQKGSVRLDDLPLDIADAATAQRWQDVLDVLNLSEMPPEDEDQPAKEALAEMLDNLTGGIGKARERLIDSGGDIVVRRLNRREYQNTIEALFGVIIPTDTLPDDESLDGFDNLGQAQSFSSLHLERYLNLGEDVIKMVFENRDRQSETSRTDYGWGEKGPADKYQKEVSNIEKNAKNATKKGDDDPEKNASLKVSQRERELLGRYLALPENKSGQVIPFNGVNSAIEKKLPTYPGRYRIRLACGSVDTTPEPDLHLAVVRGEYRSEIADSVSYHQVLGTVQKPEIIEFEVEIDGILSNRFEFRRREGNLTSPPELDDVAGYKFVFRDLKKLWTEKRANLWIDWIEVEGPLQDSEAELSLKGVLGDRDVKKIEDADVPEIIANFAFHAFRRQKADPGYLALLEKIYTEARDHGKAPEVALRDTLRVILASPGFLYLYEPRPENSPPRDLTQRELAIRLSYFLWSAPPDDELYDLAEEGRLAIPEILTKQIDRMIADPRSATFVQTFLTAWLQLDRLKGISPGATSNPVYDAAVHQETRRETYAFFNHLLHENLPVKNLLASDFAVLNSVTANFYGIPNVRGDEFRAVSLPTDSVRGGLLGQSAILALTGTGERTSPVERGVYILRKILNRSPAPAPANVPMLDEEAIAGQSMRDSLAAHMTTPQCASCHRKIDPLGFGMENFDPVGLWRESVPSKDGTASFPIEPAGTLPDGKTRFGNFLELRAEIAKDPDPFLEGLSKEVLTYGLGRTIGFTDRGMLAEIVEKTKADGGGLRDLIHRVILSPPF